MSTSPDHLFEHHHIIVDAKQLPTRIDQFLVARIASLTRTRLQSGMKQGYVHVNGNPVKPNYKVRPHDTITIALPTPPRKHELRPEKMHIPIVYQDEHILIVNKPAKLVVHPGIGNWSGTLANGLAYHFRNLPHQPGNEVRPGILHRLDKGTSGIMAIAKTTKALKSMSDQFAQRTIHRIYYALVWGDLATDRGTINQPIERSIANRKKMVVHQDHSQGKQAITHYKVIERLGYVTLITCQLETGRTHQIRAHMAFIKHPIFNDPLYGGNKPLKGQQFSKYKTFIHNCFALLPHQALHAKTLRFYHPIKQKTITLETPLPTAFQAVLNKWHRYVGKNHLK